MKKILVVDDDPDILFIYSHKLSQDFTVDQAKDGQEAIDKIRANPYDLVLLDIMLPKKNGVDILKEMKADTTIVKAPPVYLLTNLADDNMIKECFKLGAVGYIIKSQVQPADLVSEVKTYFSAPPK